MVNSEELTGSTALYTTCHINRGRYNRVKLYLIFKKFDHFIQVVTANSPLCRELVEVTD